MKNATIRKWTLAIVDRQQIMMPRNAQLLTVQMQNGLPQLWALCEAGAPTENRQIAIYGPGNPLPYEPGIYIATFQMDGGVLVWHAFWIVP